MTDERTPHIHMVNLSLSFDGHRVLKNIDMEVARNQVTAIIGPSGSGKSTLLRCLNRMVDLIPSAKIEGKILFEGHDLLAKQQDVVALRQQIGMVFQKPNPFPRSIYDNVAYGPRIRGSIRRKKLDGIVEEALRGAALWDEVKDRLMSSAMDLSGGQQQRLCIARCLAVKPQVLLMDEPCSALDPASTARIEDLVAHLRHELTVVVVTHNLQQAGRASDYTAFLLDGELIECSPTEVLFTNASDQRTDDYITGRFG